MTRMTMGGGSRRESMAQSGRRSNGLGGGPSSMMQGSMMQLANSGIGAGAVAHLQNQVFNKSSTFEN